ncbi:MAG: transporter substrate-binding domain-containing protein [Bacteroidetes bacterium]|nr:transporter substrate-binding domain-containing protein [Bacteroidota bacterium]MBL7103779.1 transporter substrate-binding domain-containing protein [Bacteroidales bacterium]
MRVSFNSILLVFTILTVYFFSCRTREKNPAETDQIVKKPENIILNRILKEKKLIATTEYNSTNYFVYRGEPMGYQYELLKSFTKFLGVKLDIKIINNLESSFDCLNEDECDLIALGLTVTKERSNIVDFSSPLSQTRQVLVQRKPDNWRKMRTMDEINSHLIRNPLNLAGKTIYIQKNTIFHSRLNNLSDEIGADINVIEHPDATVEELITMVSKGEIDYTVCDEHIALVNKKYYPDIDVRTPVSFPQHIAWAVKRGANGLLDTINFWLEGFIKTRTSAFLYNKYFRNPRTINYARSEYHSVTGGKISPYDPVIKKCSELIDWDWRLLASLIYQESRFYPEARSWAGAYGLMQLMPHNAQKYGIDSLSPPEEQIKAGVKFIKLLDKQFLDKIEDKSERTKFVLASYNAGIAHVYDARRLAEKYDKNPNLWNDNVDYFLRNKSKPEFYSDSVVKYGYCRGEEPYNFVYDILERYQHYKNVIVN